MSDFGDFSSSNDPTADFLARERAVLGGDVDFFTSGNDLSSMNYDTLQDYPSLFSQTSDVSSHNNYGVQSINSTTAPSEYPSFEADYPKAEHLESSKAFHKAMLPEEEPDVVRQWRTQKQEAIAKKAEEEKSRKEEIINKAREEIDLFYEEYNDKKQKATEEHREREEVMMRAKEVLATSNIWECVVREFDVSNAKAASTRDVSRMKALMLDLRKDNKAPGSIIHSN
ncbi:clathrin light chain [Pilobolus umbonatus]|nr:clathrin light chain [Pilobolus umbonatus]